MSRPKASPIRLLAWLAALAVVAALGIALGRSLPLTRGLFSDRTGSSRPPPAEEVELPLEEQLAAVRAGRSITIHVTRRPLADDQLAPLAAEKNLQWLLLDHPGNAITSEGCRTLGASPSLVHLRIRGGTIDDAGLAHLAELATLEILNLPQCRCTDRGLAALAALPRLRQLRLGGPHLTDGLVAELKKLPALAQLHLIDVPITDAGLAELATLQGLSSLYLDGSRVTDEGLSRLFAARRDLHVHIDQQHHDRDPQRHEHASAGEH